MKDNALYLEVDEDITSAIDKLSKSGEGPVQIVVPKRSTMLQSIINLKLLKKAADQGGKEIVLVTGDRIATELAARVGLAVAPSVGAKAVMTEAKMPEDLKTGEEVIEAGDPEPPPAPEQPVPPAAKIPKKPLLRRLPISDGPPPPSATNPLESPSEDAAAAPTDAAPAKAKKPPKVPNFGRLQRRVMWVGAGVVLVGGYMLAMYLFTSAKVTLYATGSKVSVDTTYAIDPAGATDQGAAVLAGQTVTVSKDLNGPFTPTGKKDAGTKASGNITAYNEYDTSSHAFVAGTRFQAPDGKIFRTTADSSVPGATVGLQGGQIVLNPGKSDPIPVEADQSGDTYNEAPAKYSIPGYSGSMQAKIYGQGAQMSGGTTKTVTIVAQSDVDTEKAALLDKDKDASARDLAARVPSGYVAIPASQTVTTDNVSSSPAVGSEGDTGHLSFKVTYTVLAVKKSDYSDLLHVVEQKQVGSNNQIYDDGLGNAQVTAANKDSAGRQTFHLTTEAYGGAKLDKAAIADRLKGQRFGDASNTASGLPGVTRADISISPPWQSSMPSRSDKISITITVAQSK